MRVLYCTGLSNTRSLRHAGIGCGFMVIRPCFGGLDPSRSWRAVAAQCHPFLQRHVEPPGMAASVGPSPAR